MGVVVPPGLQTERGLRYAQRSPAQVESYGIRRESEDFQNTNGDPEILTDGLSSGQQRYYITGNGNVNTYLLRAHEVIIDDPIRGPSTPLTSPEG